jgi:glycosidase
MNHLGFFHHANSEWSYIDGTLVTLRFRSVKDDLLSVTVIEYNRFTDYQKRRKHEMRRFLSDFNFDYYTVSFKPDNEGCIYYFFLTDGNKTGYYGEFGFSENEFVRMGAYEIPRIQPTDIYQAPDWVSEAIFYQIYPDRFCKSNAFSEGYEPWGSPPTYWNVFGGDFQGIVNQISHLKELGINAIYLTPISLSNSSHRYDTIDYLKIDPRLGTEDDFLKLVNNLHQNGIKIVLDAVFNHSSSDFHPFKDVLKNQEKSRYKDWFLIEKFPVKVERDKTYQTFGFEPHMPKLNSLNSEVRDYLIKVGKYYIEKFDIDGWRLDVADEVDSDFWRMFRKEIKKAKPSAIIIGEVWHNSDYYLRGDQFDSVQNYQFFEVSNNYFLKKTIDLATFRDQLVHLLMMYPDPVQKALLNQLDSHDVPRILHVAKDDLNAVKLAVVFQMTFQGMPCIYYGDEVGMTGGGDPDNRRCFDWNQKNWNHDLFQFYRQIIEFRKNNQAIKYGSYEIINHPHLFMYKRCWQGECVLICINPNAYQVQIELPSQFVNSNSDAMQMVMAESFCIFSLN